MTGNFRLKIFDFRWPEVDGRWTDSGVGGAARKVGHGEEGAISRNDFRCGFSFGGC